MPSWTAPTPEQIATALRLTPRAAEFRYFVDNLHNPFWVIAFHKADLFASPPEPVVDAVAGTVHFPAWPLSTYLKRVARDLDDPEMLLAVIQVASSTKNVHVQRDLLSASLALPGMFARQVSPTVTRWLLDWHPGIVDMLVTELGVLLEHLAREGEYAAAARVARAVLYISKAPEHSDRFWPDLVGRVPAYWYGEFLKHLQPLVQADPDTALVILMDTLEKALDFTVSVDEARKSTVGYLDDNSTLWRPDLERRDEWSVDDYRDHLVDALVSALQFAMQSSDHEVKQLVLQLEARRWLVFHRLGLYVLALVTPLAADAARERLIDVARLHDEGLWREYKVLLNHRYGELGAGGQALYLRLVDAGPDPELDGPSTDEQAAYWRYKRLFPIRDQIEAVRATEVAALLNRFGSIDDSPVVISGWVGDISPKSAYEIGSMTITDLVQFLASWSPPPAGFPQPSSSALATELEGAVKLAPNRYAVEVNQFLQVPSEYQTAVLRGLSAGLELKQIAEWDGLLVLASRVSGRPDSTNEMKKAVLRVLDKGFDVGESEIPIGLREAVWSVIRRLVSDQNPTPDTERTFVSPEPDPLSMAINSVRGAAIEAVVRYALWVSRHTVLAQGAARSFESMPEVRGVLEEGLDISIERTLAVRAVFGRFLPQLHFLDQAWLASHTFAIFPEDGGALELRRAVWETFVVTNPASSMTFSALRPQYEWAVTRIQEPTFSWRHLGEVNNSLGDHLVTLYWRGVIELEDPLLMNTFLGLSKEGRQQVLEYVGRVLRREDDEVEAAILTRLAALWLWRRSEIAQGRADPSELCAFTSWFTSKCYDDSWAIEQLTHALVTGECHDSPFLAEMSDRLANATTVSSDAVIDAFGLVVHSDRWGMISRSHNAARNILKRALDEGGEPREKARALIDKLARNGNLGFVDLVRP